MKTARKDHFKNSRMCQIVSTPATEKRLKRNAYISYFFKNKSNRKPNLMLIQKRILTFKAENNNYANTGISFLTI